MATKVASWPALMRSGAQATPCRARCQPLKNGSSGVAKTVTCVSSAVRLPEPGRMLAFSNHVKSKSWAVQSIEEPDGWQVMFQVGLVASATTSATVG